VTQEIPLQIREKKNDYDLARGKRTGQNPNSGRAQERHRTGRDDWGRSKLLGFSLPEYIKSNTSAEKYYAANINSIAERAGRGRHNAKSMTKYHRDIKKKKKPVPKPHDL